MLDVIELQKDLIRVDHRPAAIFPAVVREDVFDQQSLGLIERQYPVVKNIHCSLRQLRGIELPEGKRSLGVHNGLEVNPADAFQGAYHEGILAKQVCRIWTFPMTLAETGIGLLQKRDLLFRKIDILAALLFLHAKQSFVAGLHLLFDPDVPNRAGRNVHILQTKLIRDLHRTPGWMLVGKSNYLLPQLGSV
jgi:hypothetical protein